MKKKLLIIGNNSFIALNIYKKLKDKIHIKKIKFSSFANCSINFLSKFDYILNCSLCKQYVLKKYNKKFDLDLYIINKIQKLNIKYIFLSTRKVYKPKFNIYETDKTLPRKNYEKNKLVTENYIKKIIPDNYIILRISNIIGFRFFNNKRSHNLFLDNFILNFKNNFLLNHNNVYKDFISINQFSYIFLRIIKKNLKGVFNISLGKKIYVSEILQWLTSSSKKILKIDNFYSNKIFNNDSFTLNNQKISKVLNITIKKKDLKAYCLNLSKKHFQK